MKSNFERIMQGLAEMVEIEAGRADPSTYRVHVSDPKTGRMMHVPGMRIGPAEPRRRSVRISAIPGLGRRRPYQRAAKTALFAELYARTRSEVARASVAAPFHAAE